MYTWILNFYIQICPYKNLESIYNIFSSKLSFPLLILFCSQSKYQPLEAPSKIKSLLFFIIWIISSSVSLFINVWLMSIEGPDDILSELYGCQGKKMS